MKVADCKGCEHCEKRRWVQYYVPANYHPIGYTHAYAHCTKHDKRVAEIKSCGERSKK